MYDIPFDTSFLQLSNSIRHVMPSIDIKPELTAKASMAQPVSQPAVYANGLMAIQNKCPRNHKPSYATGLTEYQLIICHYGLTEGSTLN
jgi:hypothetical protein